MDGRGVSIHAWGINGSPFCLPFIPCPQFNAFAGVSFFFFSPLIVGGLQIESSEETDQGKYECVASNSAGVRYSSPANLYVRGRERRGSQQWQYDPFALPTPWWTFSSSLLLIFYKTGRVGPRLSVVKRKWTKDHCLGSNGWMLGKLEGNCLPEIICRMGCQQFIWKGIFVVESLCPPFCQISWTASPSHITDSKGGTNPPAFDFEYYYWNDI